MIEEDYVSFEIAKLLKEKEFNDIDCECHGWVGRSGKHYSSNDTFYDTKELKKAQEDRKDFIPLITLQMAMKWLREVHDIYIMIDKDFATENGWHYVVVRRKDWADNIDNCLTQQESNNYTYEFACEAAIKFCLENLI